MADRDEQVSRFEVSRGDRLDRTVPVDEFMPQGVTTPLERDTRPEEDRES